MLLEIAVFNFHSALLAAGAGADRLELCENPYEGGTTPSYGYLKAVREKIDIPVFPIIRPRGGDFLFTEAEYGIMSRDIRLCKELGFEGVVTGGLQSDGSIAVDALSRLVELAYPMEVTFHRAFDRAAQPMEALEQIIHCGCSRILTSGQVPEAENGKELIKELVARANNRITILPGSGIRSKNIGALARYTGVAEMHSSARKRIPSPMNFTATAMQENLDSVTVDENEIREMKQMLLAIGQP